MAYYAGLGGFMYPVNHPELNLTIPDESTLRIFGKDNLTYVWTDEGWLYLAEPEFSLS